MAQQSTLAEKRPRGRDQSEAATEAKRLKRRKLAKQSSAAAAAAPAAEKETSAHKPEAVESDSTKPAAVSGTELQTVGSSTDVLTAPDPSTWAIAQTTGGRFSDNDPILTHDKKHLILSIESAVQVFSIATSSLVRSLRTDSNAKVSSHRLSSSDEDHIYISTSLGEVSLWDWTECQKLSSFNYGRPIVDIANTSLAQDNDSLDLLFTLCENESGVRSISAAIANASSEQWRSKEILKSDKPITAMQVSADGKVIVLSAREQLIVGYTSHLSVDGFDGFKYSWLEFDLPVTVTCLDIRKGSPASEAHAKKGKKSRKLDLVLGEQNGSILIYRDFLNALLRKEKHHDSELIPSRLHWHRYPVKAVRWSRDGNYLISGGLENVLVLWQLDSGRKQFLPHLSSHICALTVSAEGDAYALKLADNSAMVLSTAELRPTANISGLQLPSLMAKGAEMNTVPAMLHPHQTGQLLLAVPSAPSVMTASPPPTSFLQTFDSNSGRHVARQALTRTNVSVLNTGPEGTELTTPNVTHMQITSDGDWLATVDEWYQYKQDALVLNPSSVQPLERREIFVKFWHWNESSREWELNTRVEAPHFESSVGSAPIHDLAVNPEESTFATIGGDSVLRLWVPKARMRSNQRVRDGRNQEGLVTWRCRRAISLEKPRTVAKHGRLSFSPDGSVLAVCWPGKKYKGFVHLIDPQTGEFRLSRDGLYAGNVKNIGFVNRYFVVLSDRLTVWDIVADQTQSVQVAPKGSFSPDYIATTCTFNPTSETFAVVFTNKENSSSLLMIFSPRSFTPLFQTRFDHQCVSLLADVKSGNYIFVDSVSQIHHVASGREGHIADELIETVPALDALPRTGLSNIFGKLPAAGPETQDTSASDYAEGGAQASGKSLADLFDVGPSFALPGVQKLFGNIVEHFAA